MLSLTTDASELEIAEFDQSAEKKWSLIIIQDAKRRRKHKQKPGSL